MLNQHNKTKYSTIFKYFQSEGLNFFLTGNELKCYPNWYYLLNYLINSYNSSVKINNKRQNIISRFLKIFIKSIKNSLQRGKYDKIDLIFVSRRRFIPVTILPIDTFSDYLFFNLIEEIHKKYPNIKMKLLIDEEPDCTLNIEAENIFNNYHFSDFIRSILYSIKYWFLGNYFHYKEYQNTPLSTIGLFFQLKRLFSCSYYDFAYYNSFMKSGAKLIIANDDCLYLKPKLKNFNFKFYSVQSASMIPELEKINKFFIEYFGDESNKADIFFCTGKYFQELKKYSLTSKKVIISGQTRYDHLTKKYFSKDELYKKYNINNERKILLWATQTHGNDNEENIRMILAFNQAVRDIENVQIIIKLHPGEDQTAILYKKYSDFRPLIFGKEADTNELLYISDIMVTKNSTTAMEAVVLDVPIIILNLSGEPDIVNYVKEGVALGAYNEKEFSEEIKYFLNNRNLLQANREKFIEKYLNRVDGGASQRIIDNIELQQL